MSTKQQQRNMLVPSSVVYTRRGNRNSRPRSGSTSSASTSATRCSSAAPAPTAAPLVAGPPPGFTLPPGELRPLHPPLAPSPCPHQETLVDLSDGQVSPVDLLRCHIGVVQSASPAVSRMSSPLPLQQVLQPQSAFDVATSVTPSPRPLQLALSTSATTRNSANQSTLSGGSPSIVKLEDEKTGKMDFFSLFPPPLTGNNSALAEAAEVATTAAVAPTSKQEANVLFSENNSIWGSTPALPSKSADWNILFLGVGGGGRHHDWSAPTALLAEESSTMMGLRSGSTAITTDREASNHPEMTATAALELIQTRKPDAAWQPSLVEMISLTLAADKEEKRNESDAESDDDLKSATADECPTTDASRQSTSPTSTTTASTFESEEDVPPSSDGKLQYTELQQKDRGQGFSSDEEQQAVKNSDDIHVTAATAEFLPSFALEEDRNDLHETNVSDEDRQQEKVDPCDGSETNHGLDPSANTQLTTEVCVSKADSAADNNNDNANTDNVEGTGNEEHPAASTLSPDQNAGFQPELSPNPQSHEQLSLPKPSQSPPIATPSLRPQTTLRPNQEKPPLPYHIRTSREAMAAVEFLHLLHKEREAGGNWPDSQVQLRMFLTKLTNGQFSKMGDSQSHQLPKHFSAWFGAILKRHKKDSKRLNKSRNTALNQLLIHLESLECVKTGGSGPRSSDLRWNQRKISSLLSGYERHQEKKKEEKQLQQAEEQKLQKQNPTEEKEKEEPSDSVVDTGKERGEHPNSSPETTSDSANSSIWQNRHKVEALVSGYQPPKAKSAAPATKPFAKTVNSLVVLKKPSRASATALAPLSALSTNGEKQSASKLKANGVHQSLLAPRGGQGFVNGDNNKLSILNTQSKKQPEPGSQAKSLRRASGTASGTVASEKNMSEAPHPQLDGGPQSQCRPANVPGGEGPRSALPPSSPLVVSSNFSVLLDLLPPSIAQELSNPSLQQDVSDIVLDKGREVVVWAAGRRVELGENSRHVVTSDDIQTMVQKLGEFGSNNRVGFHDELHSVSAIRNRKKEIIGLTVRIGREVSGNAAMVSDLLFDEPTKSVLFLGKPGSGKTTVLREVAKLLAEHQDVMIVDSCNEIAGDGDVAHPSVGRARRMMVSSLTDQASVMAECLQNHSPEVMIIDKIGHPDEVRAAQTAKQWGVRLIASVNGDFEKLVGNASLRWLVEGSPARNGNDGRIEGEAPIFDMVVELNNDSYHDWRIISDAAEAAGKLSNGNKYRSERRLRNPDDGTISVEVGEGV